MSLDLDADADLDPAQLASILSWYAEMGVDIAVGDQPRDRFAESAVDADRASSRREAPVATIATQSRSPAPAPRPTTMEAAALVANDAALAARDVAAAARTLDELRVAMESFDGCALKRTASRLVFAEGASGSRVMLIGDAPSGDDDRQGRPFVGRAGELLDRMLASIGLDRAQVCLAHVAPWRPPGNRAPTTQETAICLPFIHRQIALVKPEILVCMGAFSIQSLLGMRENVMRARGQWREFTVEADDGARKIRALATFNPNYLLNTPIAKRQAWADLRALRKALDQA